MRENLELISEKVEQASAIIRILTDTLNERTWEDGAEHIPSIASAAAAILDEADGLLSLVVAEA